MPEYLYRLEHPNDTSIYGQSPSKSPCTDTQASTQNDDSPYNDYYDQNSDDYSPENTAPINSNFPETTTLCNSLEQNSTIDIEEQEKRHEYLTRENVHVGLMFGSKALIQLITNPLVGPMTNRYNSLTLFAVVNIDKSVETRLGT
uniref:Uncharacterized protein n=1 Tax=Romanomermis culicivorax TaxID=13658 RepID=A0A915HLI3_ROMCU